MGETDQIPLMGGEDSSEKDELPDSNEESSEKDDLPDGNEESSEKDLPDGNEESSEKDELPDGNKESSEKDELPDGNEESSTTKVLLDSDPPKSWKDFECSDDGGVVVLGSGDFGRAIAVRLRQAGLGGMVASRDPDRNRSLMEDIGCGIGTYDEVLPRSRLVVLAVPHECHQDLPLKLLYNKIIVDVSNRNREEKAQTKSIAEALQESLPGSRVVKAFNTLSAHALGTGSIQGSKEVPICGDDPEARSDVAQVVRDLGFIPVDTGGLRGAARLEEQALRFFSPEWRFALAVSAGLFAFVWTFFLFRIQLCPGLTNGEWDPGRFKWLAIHNTQITCSVVAITQLTLCYVPELLVAYLQLWRGTKYSRFPRFLDRWIRSRKQMVLLVLLMGTLHGSMSMMERLQDESDYSWVFELQLMAGIVLWCLLVILGIVSLPSVTASMSWREFSFLQSKIGWLALSLAFTHVALLGGKFIFYYSFRCHILPTGTKLCILLPFFTLLFKMPLVLPGFVSKVSNIRRGYRHLRQTPEASEAV